MVTISDFDFVTIELSRDTYICAVLHICHIGCKVLRKMAVLRNTHISTIRFLSKNGTERYMVTAIGCDTIGYNIHFRRLDNLTSSKINKVYQHFGAAGSKSSTGNKPTSIHAGGNVTNINYYGYDYAAAKTDANTTMDPERFTKPITAIMDGPALKSPTVEECGYSDRVMQLTAGNSTITTQEAVDAVVAYAHWPEPSTGSGEAIDKLSTPGPAVDRFYTLDSVDWSTSFPGRFFRLPGVLSDLGVFGQNCAFHYLMRSGFCVHLQLNASKFHQGCVMLVAIPECQMTGTSGLADEGNLLEEFYIRYPVHQLTVFPHQFVNLRTNNSATLILPYINSVPAENPITHNFWTVCIIPIVPLQYNSGASTVVPMTVSIAPMYAEFSGLRQAVPVRQGIPTFHVPGSGQFVTTLRNTGYPLYPEFEATHSHYIPGRVNNLMEVMQVDTFCKGPNGSAHLLIDVGVKTDAALLTVDMDLNSDFFQTSYLARACKWFTNYRGSVRLTFTFCGSAMATGKLLLAYTPPGGDAPSTRKDAMLGTHMVWDLGLQSSVTFIVPWISQTQYRLPNASSNIYNYAGYVTMWYQTSIVVPPGAPSTCSITTMVGACSDFQVRLPTDNAYYQGLGDTLGKMIEHKVETVLQNVDVPAVQHVTKDIQDGEVLAVQSGDAPALTASETGVSTTTSPDSVMETRSVPVSFSARESDIENFFSRYASLYDRTTDWGQINTSYTTFYHKIPIKFNDIHTNPAIKTKYNMFTYFRCNYDFVVVIDNISMEFITSDQSSNLPTNAISYPVRYKIMFCPPSSVVPSDAINNGWSIPTQPQIMFVGNSVPASFRIPFMSVANAYRCFFDGYSTFNNSSNAYGVDPGNDIGTLVIAAHEANDSNTARIRYRTNIRVFARPVNVQAWCPRPIVSSTARVSVQNSNTRTLCVDGDSDYCLRIGAGPWGTDVKNFGNSDMEWEEECGMKYDEVPKALRGWLHQCPIFQVGGNFYHMIPISRHLALANHHLFLGQSDLRIVKGPQKWTIEHLDITRDLCVIKFPDGGLDPIPMCDTKRPRHAWILNEAGKNKFLYSNNIRFMEGANFLQSEWTPAHSQFGLIELDVPTGPGWCGSPVLCRNGVCGYVTGGSDTDTLAVCLHSIEILHKMDIQKASCGASDYQLGYFVNHKKKMSKSHDYRNYNNVEEQGPMQWVRDLGAAFGIGATESAYEQAKALVQEHVQEWNASSISRQVVGWLIKAICATVLISRSWNVAETAACVGIMLGVDFVNSSPFDWVKQQIYSLLGMKHEQGFSDWIKEFNVFCTAARGLEWVGQELSKLVQWIQDFIRKNSKEYKEYLECMKCFPDLMDSIDRYEKSRGSYSIENVKKVIINMKSLKNMVDKYGCSNTQVVRQIIQYYDKVKELDKGLSESRHEPVATLIRGGPGSGKSLATSIIGRALAKFEGSGQVYCLPPDAKHFDGYCQQPVVIMDDVGQNPDGEDLKLFCQMVSSTEFIPPMAELNNKGKPFTTPYVLASSNCDELKPPTISTPAALHRRFFYDLSLTIKKEFNVGGRLDAHAALKPCNHLPTTPYFTKCCPLICGQAILLEDKKLNKYTIEQIVEGMVNEQRSRSGCVDKLEALFQGPICPSSMCDGEMSKWTHRPIMVDGSDEWLQTDFDREGCKLLTLEEQVQQKKLALKPLPQEVADLIRAIPDEKIIKYCAQQGWCLEPVKVNVTREKVCSWVYTMLLTLTGLTLAGSIALAIYSVYQMFAKEQGPYGGPVKKKIVPPKLRTAVVPQGPNYQFEQRLFSSSLFDVETRSGHFSGLGLYDQWLLLPKHVKIEDTIKVEGVDFKVLDAVELMSKDGPLELIVAKIDRPVKFRDLRKYFPDSFSKFDKCTLLVNNENFRQMFCPVGVATRYGRLNLSGNMVSNTCMYPFPTKCGQCGGVVTSNNKIIAMHIGGDGLNGYGAILTNKLFVALDEPKQQQGEIKEKRDSSVKVNLNAKTKLRPSVFFDVFPGNKEPAALHPNDDRLEVELEAALFAKYKGNREVACPELDIAIAHYVEQIRPLMPDNVTDPLPLEDVVYGIDNLEGLDLNTSAGYPYNIKGIKKRDLIPERGEPLTKLIEALDLNGKYLPYTTYLKDELRPLEKVKAGKTRLIECSSLNDTIHMKQRLGRLFQTFHANPGVVTGCAVGCDPDVHWSKFYAEMGDQPLIAFDYSNYDASLGPMWFEALKKVLIRIGYCDIDKLIDHVCNSTHLYKNIEYDVVGGMPSGCSGTSIFNSIINNLIIRTLVLRVYKDVDLDSLKIIAYGDDVIASYPFELDASLLAKAGLDFGLQMTPPDKGADFKKMTWDEVTFLKRRFVPDEQFPFLIHPVYPMSEVHESIRWTRSAASTQEHVYSLCLLAWHNGKDDYQELITKIRTVPVGRALFLPAYEVLQYSWLSKF